MLVRTDHQIVASDMDHMALIDYAGGEQIITAERRLGVWVVGARGVPDRTAETRGAAIADMTDMALVVLPGDGYSTFVPHGLADLP